jgi:hypothetical protein
MSTPVREAGGELAVQLGRLSGVAQRLLAVHVPDQHGRCRGCTTPGTGLPGAVWPCALHFYASAAAAARVVGG